MSNFVFNNKKYSYFKHRYNETHTNERTIEIPICLDIIKKYKNILEVGNVLSHYHRFKHDTIDLYEEDKNVINQDIRTFKTDKKYDLIVSISTIEHVDNGEQGILDTLSNMKTLLKSFGDIYITFPIAQNSDLDSLLKNKKLGFKELYYMKKDMFDDYKFDFNIWEQCEFSDIHSFNKCVVGYPNAKCNTAYSGFWPITVKVIYLAIGRV